MPLYRSIGLMSGTSMNGVDVALVGVEVTPLGLGLWAMLALLGVVVAAWMWEGRR